MAERSCESTTYAHPSPHWTSRRAPSEPPLLATVPPTFLLIAAPYPEDLLTGAKDTGATGISTGALELAAYAIVAEKVCRRTGASALLTFTDADAAKGAVNSGGSSAPAE